MLGAIRQCPLVGPRATVYVQPNTRTEDRPTQTGDAKDGGEAIGQCGDASWRPVDKVHRIPT